MIEMELPNGTVKIFKINSTFARSKKAPVYFIAKVIKQTPKAVYLYGHGTVETKREGVCCICGWRLTHPVSISVGVGPECGKHFHDWDLIGGYSKENADAITKAIIDIKVEGWFPKSIIKETMETTEDIHPPADHPMLKKPKKQIKKASLIDSSPPLIKIEFPFSQEILYKVKLLPGRRFHNEGQNKYWTAPLSIETVEQLQEIGFQMDLTLMEYMEKSTEPIETKIKPLMNIDFSLCPLYNGVWNNNQNIGEDYAQRSLPTHNKSVKSRQEEFSKRTSTRSQTESNRNTEENCRRSRMTGKSIQEHDGSDASTRNQEKAFERIGKSPSNSWDQLQRRERPRDDFDSENCKQIINQMWIHKGISNPNKRASDQVQACCECIQSRLCPSRRQNSDRTGRSMPPSDGTTTTGQEKGCGTEKPWMDCNTLKALQTFLKIDGIQRALYHFQLEDVMKVEALQGRCLIASEMGLGKTAQSLAWLQLHPEKRPVVIVVPASLKLNWERECSMWISNPKVQILSGKKANTPIVGEIIIINYDIIGAWVKALKAIKPQVLVLDEVHKIKNKGTQRTKAVTNLAKSTPHIIGLSGTPIENRPAEIYNAVKMIDPGAVGTWTAFGKRYCDGKYNGWGWDFNGASNIAKLHEKLTSTVMIRRKKADVLKDLPAKVRSFVPMEINNRKKYKVVEADFIGWVKREKGLAAAEKAGNAEALAKISALKQLAAEGKMTQAIDWIKDHLDTNGKLVVFAVHKKTIDRLMNELADYSPVKVDGSVSQDNRQVAVDTFQNNPRCRVFVGNINAAGVGLTLTAASSVAFAELPWSPSEIAQAEDRCHRIGQKYSVNIYFLLSTGTIEETTAKLIDDKRKVLDQVLDGIETESTNLLGELMEQYSKS
jgi:SWI/SNF-related matrix-associated actin-dependent regulator 1 of chromatin subfamily A